MVIFRIRWLILKFLRNACKRQLSVCYRIIYYLRWVYNFIYSINEVCFTYNKMNGSQVFNLKSFDNSILPHTHYPKLDMAHFHHPRKFLYGPLQSVFPSRGNHSLIPFSTHSFTSSWILYKWLLFLKKTFLGIILIVAWVSSS